MAKTQNLYFYTFFLSAIGNLFPGAMTTHRFIDPLIMITSWRMLNRQLMKKTAVIQLALHHDCEDLEKK